MPSTESYNTFAAVEESPDGYQIRNEKLAGAPTNKQTSGVTSKVVVAVGLFAAVGTIAASGYMPKLMPAAELQAGAPGSCVEQVGCAEHGDACSTFDPSKISCKVPAPGFAFTGDIVEGSCLEQHGCATSSDKCMFYEETEHKSLAFGEVNHDKLLVCEAALEGFYVFEGVVGQCDTVTDAVLPVECTPPDVIEKTCMTHKFRGVVTVDGVTKEIVQMEGIGEKFKAVMHEALPDPGLLPGIEIVGIDVDPGDDDRSYSYDRRLSDQCQTNSGESCAKYLFSNLVKGDNDKAKCSFVDRLMNDGPTTEEEKLIAGWEADVEAQGCFDEVSKDKFPEVCLEPEFRLHCEEVFNSESDRRLSLWKVEEPTNRFLADIEHPHLPGARTVHYTLEFAYKFCDLPPPGPASPEQTEFYKELIEQKIVGEDKTIHDHLPGMNEFITTSMSTFAQADIHAEITDGGPYGDAEFKNYPVLTPNTLIFTCEPQFFKTEEPPSCTDCTMQDKCATDAEICLAAPSTESQCTTAEDGYYVDASGVVKECTPVKECAGKITCAGPGASTCHECAADHYHVDEDHDICKMCKNQEYCVDVTGMDCLDGPGMTMNPVTMIPEPLTEYLECAKCADGHYLDFECENLPWENSHGHDCAFVAPIGAADWTDITGVRADKACCAFGGGIQKPTGICKACPLPDPVSGATTCKICTADHLTVKFDAVKPNYKYRPSHEECKSDGWDECQVQEHCMAGESTDTCTAEPDKAHLMCIVAEHGYYTQDGIVKKGTLPDNCADATYTFDVAVGLVTTVTAAKPGYYISADATQCLRCATQDLCAPGASIDECFIDEGVHTLVCMESKDKCGIYLAGPKTGACFDVAFDKCTECTGPAEADITSNDCENMYFNEDKLCKSCMGSRFSPNVKSFMDQPGDCVIEQCHPGYKELHGGLLPPDRRNLMSTEEMNALFENSFVNKKSVAKPAVENKKSVAKPAVENKKSVAKPAVENKKAFGATTILGCVNIDYCEESPCAGPQTCEDAAPPKDGAEEDDKFYCFCPAGKSGAHTTNKPAECADVDNCAGTHCGAMAVCKDHPFDSAHGASAYDCICDTGAEGASTISAAATCTDVDGCAGTECGASASCTDVKFPGTGHTCKCDAGFYNAGSSPLDNDAHTNTAVDCKETTAQAGCATSVDGAFCEDTTLEFKPCTTAEPGSYIEGTCKASTCPEIPDTMIPESVECTRDGVKLVAPFGLCKQPYFPEPGGIDGRGFKTEKCSPCASQVGCLKDSTVCSLKSPTLLGCDEPEPNFIIVDTDIVAKAARRLRGD
jgi:hypothetical protein